MLLPFMRDEVSTNSIYDMELIEYNVYILANYTISIHTTGLLGVLMVPFFHKEKGIFFVGSTRETSNLLGINVLGAIVIIVWTAIWS